MKRRAFLGVFGAGVGAIAGGIALGTEKKSAPDVSRSDPLDYEIGVDEAVDGPTNTVTGTGGTVTYKFSTKPDEDGCYGRLVPAPTCICYFKKESYEVCPKCDGEAIDFVREWSQQNPNNGWIRRFP